MDGGKGFARHLVGRLDIPNELKFVFFAGVEHMKLGSFKKDGGIDINGWNGYLVA